MAGLLAGYWLVALKTDGDKGPINDALDKLKESNKGSDLDDIKKSERGEYELTHAISFMAEKGKVKVIKLKDYWLDLGSLDDIPRIEQFLTSKR